jgi:hypothetical protein
MSKPTDGVQATPAAPAAKPESSTLPTRQQVFGAATKAFADYHGLGPKEEEAPEVTTADAPDSESAAAETETALSQEDSETPAASSEDTAETETTGEGEETEAGAEEPKPDDGPALTKGMQKRIAKLEEKHQREVEALQAKLDELQSKQPDPTATAAAPASAPSSYDPVEAVPEVAALRTQQQEHQRTVAAGRQMLKDLETNPERVLKHLGMDDVDAAREAIEGKVEEVQGILSGIQSDLSIERREARKAITEVKARVEHTAKTEFPWVSDPKDPRAVLRKNSLAALGPYANHTSAPLFSAVWAQWLHDYNARSAKPAAKTDKPAPPKATVARRTAAPPAAQPAGRGDAAGASEKSEGKSPANHEKTRRGYFDGLAASALKTHASPR